MNHSKYQKMVADLKSAKNVNDIINVFEKFNMVDEFYDTCIIQQSLYDAQNLAEILDACYTYLYDKEHGICH